MLSSKVFRLLVDISDRVNIWCRDVFGIDPKRKVMEKTQDLTPLSELDNTIGKSLDIL